MTGFEIPGFDIPGGDSLLPRPRFVGEQEPASKPTSAPSAGESADFSSALTDAINEVDQLRGDASDKVEALASGEPVELHELMIAMGKSEVAFNLMLEVRNKMVEAWHTLSRSVV